MVPKQDPAAGRNVITRVQIQQIQDLASTIRYGSITLVFQDGTLVQIDKNEKYVYKKHKIDWTNRKFCMLHHAVAYKISGFNYLAKPLRYLLICVDSTTTLILYSLPPPFVAPTPKHNCNKLILYQEEGVQTANRQVTHLSCSTFFVETRQNPLLSFCERCRTFFPRCRGPPLLKSSILPKFQKMGGLLYVAGVHKESKCDPLTETKYR